MFQGHPAAAKVVLAGHRLGRQDLFAPDQHALVAVHIRQLIALGVYFPVVGVALKEPGSVGVDLFLNPSGQHGQVAQRGL